MSTLRLSRVLSAGLASSDLVTAAQPWWLDVDAAGDGQTVYLWGRNLEGQPVTVGGVSATVARSGDGVVKFAMPSGLSGPQPVLVGDVPAGSLNAVGAVSDPLGIGLAWAGDMTVALSRTIDIKSDWRLSNRATGDGVANDAPALRDAIVLAANLGGAVIDFPAGIYRVDDGVGSFIEVKAGTILRGVGERTVLEVGYRYTPSSPVVGNKWALALHGDHIVLKDLRIDNLSTDTAVAGVFQGWSGTANIKCALIGVTVNGGNTKRNYLTNPTDCVIRGCAIRSTSVLDGPFSVSGNRMRVLDSTFDYRNGRLQMNFCQRTVLDRVDVRVNGAFHVLGSIETGGLENSVSYQFGALDSSAGFYGPKSTKGLGDGECLASQITTGVHDYHNLTTVSSASGNVVTVVETIDSDPWLDANNSQFLRHFAFVKSGAAAGQWRAITAHGSHTLTLASAFSPQPAAGDVVSVTSLGAFQHTYMNCDVYRGYEGIQAYGGALMFDVLGCFGENAGVRVRADSRDPAQKPTPTSGVNDLVLWDARVLDCRLADRDSLVPVAIKLDALHVNGILPPALVNGVLIAGNEVRGRNVAGAGIQLSLTSQSSGPPAADRMIHVEVMGNELYQSGYGTLNAVNAIAADNPVIA